LIFKELFERAIEGFFRFGRKTAGGKLIVGKMILQTLTTNSFPRATGIGAKALFH